MEDQDSNTQSNSSIWQGIKDGVFNVFVEMLKSRKVSQISATFLMSFTFLQIYGTILRDSEFIKWNDDIAADSIYTIFNFIRIIPAVIKSGSGAFFWFFYNFCIFLRINKK